MIQVALVISAALFILGMTTVLTRRNAIILFMGIELMLNAANLAFVAFAKLHQNLSGHIFVFMIITVAAAEAAVGLAIVIALYKNQKIVNVNEVNQLLG